MGEFDPAVQLREGAKILDPVMNTHGFSFFFHRTSMGSGGAYAKGHYRRASRTVELHYRYGLGIVRYHVDRAVLDHITYMRLLGLIRECAFSSVKMDRTLEGFHLLRQDLERFGSELLERDGDDFAKLAETAEEDMDRYRGFKALSRYERGDH